MSRAPIASASVRRASPRLVRIKSATARIGAIVIFAVTLSACGDDTDQFLEALRSDPMATANFAGAEVDREYENRTDTVLGKPVDARIDRQFSLTGSPEAVFDQAVALSRSGGWTETFSRPQSFRAERSIKGVRAVLSVIIGDLDGAPVLRVTLTSLGR